MLGRNSRDGADSAGPIPIQVVDYRLNRRNRWRRGATDRPVWQQPTAQPGPSVEDAMQHAVNPSKRDYGGLLYGWQDTAVQYTCQLGLVVQRDCGALLAAALGYIWWYTNCGSTQECFVRAAAVLIGQRNTAYQSARFAINKHNALVEKIRPPVCQSQRGRTKPASGRADRERRQSAQPLFPTDAGDAAPAIEPDAPVVEAQDGTPRENQSLKSTAPIMSGRRTTCGASTHSRPKLRNQRATIQQLKDRLSQFEGTL